ncbi:cytochrome P450 [Xylariomycetidae sp. FL2044]|nr:cytochrome P450 [Xylariomycetidae sp. FL2044]
MMFADDSFEWQSLFRPLPVVALILTYCLGTAVYRLYLSPLAKFPGPKLAALTSYYAAYYDLIRGGQYIWAVEEMHRKYGPIVRVRPDVLHVNDPAFIDIHTQSPKHRRERHPAFLNSMQTDGSILGTQDHEMHRRRRAVLNPYFSMQNVRRLEPVINDTLANLFRRLEGWARDGRPVKLNFAYKAATKDVIQAYCFGEDSPKCLDAEDCNAAFFKVQEPNILAHVGSHFNTLMRILTSIPPKIMTFFIPQIAVFANFLMDLGDQIDGIKKSKDIPEGKTIFHEIIRANLPEQEKATPRLVVEAMVLLQAGTDTTANTMAAISYHLLSRPDYLARLKAELETAMPDRYQFPVAAKLDSLPFLNAIIQEALRLHPGATHRQDRLAPDEDLVYQAGDKTWVIPAGTGVGMSAPLINKHPALYDRPDEFLPDRYLESPELRKHLLSFSKGGRQCLGINLALQELQSFTAGIFRRYNLYDPAREEQDGPTLELYHTGWRDVELYADFIQPGLVPGSQGTRVIVRH